MEKCVYCRRCESVCNNVQSVGVLSAIRRGFNTTIAPTFDKMFVDTNCTYCGQCVAVCPTGALTEHDYTNQLMDDLTNPETSPTPTRWLSLSPHPPCALLWARSSA